MEKVLFSGGGEMRVGRSVNVRGKGGEFYLQV